MKEVYWYKATVAFTGRKDEIGAEGVTLGYAMGHGRRDDGGTNPGLLSLNVFSRVQQPINLCMWVACTIRMAEPKIEERLHRSLFQYLSLRVTYLLTSSTT